LHFIIAASCGTSSDPGSGFRRGSFLPELYYKRSLPGKL